MMRRSIAVSVIIVTALAGLVFFASAQNSPNISVEEKPGIVPYIVGNGVRSPEDVALIETLLSNGRANGFRIHQNKSGWRTSGKLRIEMLDGSVQELDLKDVRRVAITR